jgi:RNA polymerase sigma-70 factor (ECF subfamily)
MHDPADRLYEQVLVVRCQTGDEDAFTALVARYGPRLRYYLRKMLPGPPDAVEDLLQDVWLDVVRGVSRLADAGAFRAWVYRIARDRVARRLRQRRPAVQPLLDLDPADDANDDDFTADDAERIHAALNDLAPEHREVLVLRFLEEMSYEEIARVVGGPLGTVRSRLHYAKRALRLALERTLAHE